MGKLIVAPLVAALGGVGQGCAWMTSHGCADIYVPSETTITIMTPGNVWDTGSYSLGMAYDGSTVQCDVEMTAEAQTTPQGLRGTCDGATNVTWALSPVCPQPPPVCTSTGCSERFSTASCLPGQYQLMVVLGPVYEPDAAPSNLPTQIDLTLSSGSSSFEQIVTPVQTASEPNGPGCGEVTQGVATVYVGGDGG